MPHFLWSQLFVSLPYPKESYAGKTVVVTGSNVGLGKEAARHFARLNASKVILAVRSIEKGNEAKRDIDETTKRAKDVVQVWKLDMGSYASVQQFAERAAKELDRIDIFIANAGVVKLKFGMLEKDEETITINVVSTFLLTALMLPKLKETATKFGIRPTFTITASEVHGWTDFPQRKASDGEIFATISDPAQEKWFKDQYPLSKLLEVLGVRIIAERHPASDSSFPVTVNCVNPGLCHSELARDLDSWTFRLMKWLIARTTEAGSRTLVHAGSAGIESHGQYMSDCAVCPPSKFVRSPEGKEVGERMWAELVKKLDEIKPGVTKNL